MAQIKVLGRKGHETLTYDRADTKDVARADQFLQEVLREGNMAYRVDGPGAYTQVREVDPAAEEIVVIAPIAGG